MALEINKYVNKNVEVIPFGVDTKLFVPIENINADFVIGTVKSLEDIYGIDRLIDVFYIVNKTLPNVICQIYGVGSKEHELKTKVLDLDLQDKVLFMGKITNNKVPAAISNFDIFCALSREESFGVAILEASSCGKPVIVSNIGGLPEVVIHNETGFIMDYNKENIAKKIIELYSDSDMINSLGKNGRAFVKNTFDWNSNVEKMKCYYAK